MGGAATRSCDQPASNEPASRLSRKAREFGALGHCVWVGAIARVRRLEELNADGFSARRRWINREIDAPVPAGLFAHLLNQPSASPKNYETQRPSSCRCCNFL